MPYHLAVLFLLAFTIYSTSRCSAFTRGYSRRNQVALSVAAGGSNHSGKKNNEDDSNETDSKYSSNNANLASTVIGRRQSLLLCGAITSFGLTSTIYDSRLSEAVALDYPNNDKAHALKNHKMLEEDDPFGRLLRTSSIYRVEPATPSRGLVWNRSYKPSAEKYAVQDLLGDLQSKRAVFLGEHHPEPQDHLLQAALIRELYQQRKQHSTSQEVSMAVGLEAVQQQFQSALDAYMEGSLNENQLKEATEWESRWYWSFNAYIPILKTCRELGVHLLALDISSEDRKKVETGGLEALGKNLGEYVTDPEGFANFGNTQAYRAYVNYTLKPPHELQKRTGSSNNISFSNFVARQMLRDEGMAKASTSWLSEHPNGLFVGCIGINHATFGCGVHGRVERILAVDNRTDRITNRKVASVLINPEPSNTGTELKMCNVDGTLVADEIDDDDIPRRLPFVPNVKNQVCIWNKFELQNYALQLNYVSSSRHPRDLVREASSMMQAKGDDVLPLSDYLMFTPL